MADVVSKKQTTAFFLSNIVTCTRRRTELKKKSDKPDGKSVLCQRTFSSLFREDYLHSRTAQFNLERMGALRQNKN
jgi:hypothetical protein